MRGKRGVGGGGGGGVTRGGAINFIKWSLRSLTFVSNRKSVPFELQRIWSIRDLLLFWMRIALEIPWRKLFSKIMLR
jgi:hypothetical protein